MEQFPAWIFWLLVAALPLGVGAAAYWAHGRSRAAEKRPVVPPGEPGNPD